MSVCLVMIARDEAEWIAPCLRSALELGIESYVIADTGSTDDTKAIAAELLAGVDGEIVDLPWEGFGPGRTEILRRARGRADLILMLDADMTIAGELPDQASSDAWLVTIIDSPLEYTLPLLVRGDWSWHYKGPVHSYLHTDEAPTWREERSSLVVQDRRPGGWRPGKLEEDARLLEAELERNPRDARSSFYLAQTYEDLGRPADALREYGRRILLGGYDQERFVAMLRRARILCERDPQRAIGACVEAWEARPTRAEPLYVAARQCRISGWNHAALTFARQAAAIPKPDDRLFVEQATYDWGIPLELGIAELRAGDPAKGRWILAETRERVPGDYQAWIDELIGPDAAEDAERVRTPRTEVAA